MTYFGLQIRITWWPNYSATAPKVIRDNTAYGYEIDETKVASGPIDAFYISNYAYQQSQKPPEERGREIRPEALSDNLSILAYSLALGRQIGDIPGLAPDNVQHLNLAPGEDMFDQGTVYEPIPKLPELDPPILPYTDPQWT